MEQPDYIEVSGYISEVKFDKDQNKIFLALDIDGERKTVEITSEQLIQFDADLQTKQSIMLKYFEAWNVRKDRGLPVRLQLTESQMRGESHV